MKKENGITLVALVITIIILIILAGISISTITGQNGIITKAQQVRQNISWATEAEAIGLNQLYTELEAIESATDEDELNGELAQTNATEDKILEGYKAYSQGQLLMGTMVNNGAINKTLVAGESYTIPKGYHNGEGVISVEETAGEPESGTCLYNEIIRVNASYTNSYSITLPYECSKVEINYYSGNGYFYIYLTGGTGGTQTRKDLICTAGKLSTYNWTGFTGIRVEPLTPAGTSKEHYYNIRIYKK